MDFCNMTDIADGSFDHAYAIEATCHAKDLILVYKEILRVLKPGGMFLDMTWAVTDDYNPEDSKHVKIVNDIMVRMILKAPTTILGECFSTSELGDKSLWSA